MKKWIGSVLIAGLLMTMTVWNVYADEVNPKPETQATAGNVTMTWTSSGIFPGGLLQAPVHEQAYLTYLVREYSPETLDSWKEAFAKRDKALEASRQQAEVPAMELVPLEAISDLNVKLHRIEGDLQNISIVKAEDGDIQPIRFMDGVSFDKAEAIEMIKVDTELPVAFKARAELRQKFEQAVQDGNGADIKALLPQLLDIYNQDTEQMANMKFFVHKAVPAELP